MIEQETVEVRTHGPPIQLPRPLSAEHQRIIELLQDHHDHTGRPIVLCESEFYVTFRVPKVRNEGVLS